MRRETVPLVLTLIAAVQIKELERLTKAGFDRFEKKRLIQ
jgi:hypothetical protein